jgi:hypothetical protein
MSNLRDRSGNVKLGRFSVLPSCFGGGRDILVLMTTRRFPPPWSIEKLEEDEPGRRSAAKLLSKDEAWRIAVNIPELLEFRTRQRYPVIVCYLRPRRDAALADLVLKQLPQNSKAASAPTPDGFAFIPLKPCCAITVDTLHGQARRGACGE